MLRNRKRPLLLSFLIVALLLVASATLFLAFYDFQAHKQRLTEQLAQHLARPVQIGEANFSLRHGPALSLTSVQIGSGSSSEFYLSAERLFLHLDWRSLLLGRLHFSEILLEAPALWITATKGNDEALPANFVQNLARAVQVDSLTVRNGSLRLLMPQVDAPATAVELRHLHASFQQLSSDTPFGLQFSGHLVQQDGHGIVQGHGQLQPAADWQQTQINLELLVRNFRPKECLTQISLAAGLPELDGMLDMQLRAEGSPAEGMHINMSSASPLSATLANGQQLSLPRWQAAGRWQTTDTRHAIDDLLLDFDGLTFTGELRIDKNGTDSEVTAQISSGVLSVARLTSLWSQTGTPALWQESLRSVQAGSLQFNARFVGGQKSLSVTDLQLALWDGAFLLPENRAVESLSLLASVAEDGSGQFEGEALLQGLPLSFSGEILDGTDHRLIRAEAQGNWPADQLLSHLPKTEATEHLRSDGHFPWRLAVAGTAMETRLEVQADLREVALHRADFPIKEAGQFSRLQLSGEITPQRLILRHGQLQLPALELQARGHLDRQDQQQFELTVDATIADLRKLRSAEEWLENWQPQGGITVNYRLSGSEGEVRKREGNLQLRRVGLHPGVVADLKDISGQLRLLDNRVESVGALRGKIGNSPAKVAMQIRDFQKPELELQVEAEAIRANELIFPSGEIMLRNVRGGLRISAEGLDFQGIRVHLDGGTNAVVDGTLRDYSEPVLELHVAASYGNIDEVIALWQHPAETPAQTADQKTRRGSYRIRAEVQHGQLGNLRFEEASGTITLPERDLLIYPLQFQVGSGQCIGQVLLTHASGAAPVLKISGAVENFDAAAIYTQLLKRRGLVSGNLRGDFYLQGEAGENFLASSSGGIDVEIRKGVLRKFRFISKVFSILNVSQILQFKLPDMAEEGMPFRRLSATFTLNEGVLSTENLFIDSNAMNLSLLGEIDLRRERLDLLLGVKPLRTVDRIITRIPLAGWVLTGEEKALITAHFQIRGSSDDPEVIPVPITSLSEKVIGIFSRVLGLPGKLIDDVGSLLEGESSK